MRLEQWRWIGVAVVGLALGACASAPAPKPELAQQALAPQQASLVADGIPERSPAVADALRAYQNTRPATFLGWLPDDAGVLVSLRFGEVAQLVKVNQPEGMRTQLSFFDEPIVQAWISPNAQVNGAIFPKDQGGDEYFQLHFINFADGQTRLLTDGKSRNESAVFAKDGQQFAYSSTRRTGRDFDIWLGDVSKDTAHRMLLGAGGTWRPLDFSSDGKQLLVQQWFSATDARIHVLDLASGELRRVQISESSSFDSSARFDQNDKNILVITDALGEYSGIVRVEREGNVVVPLFIKQDWDVEAFDPSSDGRLLAVLRNIDGSSNITIYDRFDAMTELRSIDLENGVVQKLAFNNADTEIGFGVSGPQIPGDVFSRSLNSGMLTRWTRGETGGLDSNQFISPKLVRYGGHDTDRAYMNLPRQIPAYVYTPTGPGPFPVLISIHGGPEGQSRPAFSEFIQFLVRERKMAVIVPNVRGSSGYGKTYLGLDNGAKREDAVKDIGSLLGWIGTQPEFDTKRIVVYGGSYGGYMVLASLVHYSDLLRAGVNIVGISNFVTFLENTNPYRVDQRRPEYGDERDPQMRQKLMEISPLTQVSKIKRPLLVIQGANDPRVPRSEAEQIVKAVRDNQQTAWYLLAMDEGHGFKKKGNRDRMGEAVVQFLDQHVLPVGK